MGSKRQIFILLFLLSVTAIFVVLGAVRTHTAPRLVQFEGETMGTVWHVTIKADSNTPIDPPTAEKIQSALEEALKAVDFRMSTWKEFTELSRLNAQTDISEDFPLSPELAFVMAKALEVSRKTSGAYDVTIGPLVNLWKFGPTRGDSEMPEIPSPEAIADAKAQIGWEALEIVSSSPDKKALRRTKTGLNVDLSSIAKGYGVDQAVKALETFGFENFMVEVGGEVYARGTNHLEKPWRIGIELPIPDSNLIFGAAELSGKAHTGQALATSGDYRNFKLENGRRRSHIIDPRTGYPVEHALVSVSVLAQDCMTADAWATALMVLGPEEGKLTAEREKLQVLFLIQDGQKIRSESVNFPCTQNPYLDETLVLKKTALPTPTPQIKPSPLKLDRPQGSAAARKLKIKTRNRKDPKK
ncbi:MAG: FAD:protein FMN transferase [Thermoguttaceae bacterium]|nr:FAD:protein FMN transferase [Thermoguttaceae bacterium]